MSHVSAATHQPLTQEQWDFLEENFRVRDPSSGESKAFSRLSQCQVVVLGYRGMVGSPLEKVARFAELFLGESGCLLLPGAPSQTSIDPSRFLEQGLFPRQLEMRGTMTDGGLDVDAFLATINEGHRVLKASNSAYQELKNYVRSVAAVVNGCFSAKRIGIANQELQATDDAYREIYQVVSTYVEGEPFEAVQIEQSPVITVEAYHDDIVSAVERAKDLFARIAVLSPPHLFCGSPSLYTKLKSINAEPVVLIPTKEEAKSLEKECLFMLGKHETAKLRITAKVGESAASQHVEHFETPAFPKEFVSYFDPQIQRCIHVKERPDLKQVKVTLRELADYLKTNQAFSYPKNCVLEFTDFPLRVTEEMYRLIVNGESNQIHKFVTSYINNYLVQRGFSLKSMGNDSESAVQIGGNETGFGFVSENSPLKVERYQGVCVIEPQMFFFEMAFNNRSQYKFEQNTNYHFFIDGSTKPKVPISTSAQLCEWLNQFAPDGKKIKANEAVIVAKESSLNWLNRKGYGVSVQFLTPLTLQLGAQ